MDPLKNLHENLVAQARAFNERRRKTCNDVNNRHNWPNDPDCQRVVNEWARIFCDTGKVAKLSDVRKHMMNDTERALEEAGGTMSEAIEKNWNI